MAEPLAPQPDSTSAPPPDDPTATIRLRGTIGRADVGAVCADVGRTLAGTRSEAFACDLDGVVEPSLSIVDVLARLALSARRSRRELRLEHASPAILELLALCGLADLLSGSAAAVVGDGSGGEVSR